MCRSKFWLLGISATVWRRVLVPSTCTLRELHGGIQVAMGWESIHLYQFCLRAACYGSWELSAAPRALLQTLMLSFGIGFEQGSDRVMSDFKGRHFEGEIVLWAVRWYCRYGVSYRDLEQMMGERGILVDHSTIYR